MKKVCALCLLLCFVFPFAASGEARKLLWEVAGALPAQKGHEVNAGTAGLLNGVVGNYIVVGGGANFPDKPLTEGGAKVTHKDLYLLEEKDGVLTTVEQIQLDHPIGYGGSASEGDAIFYLGGSPEEAFRRDVLKVTVKDGHLAVEKAGVLPRGFESGVCRFHEGKIYFGVGKVENDEGKLANSNRFFRYDPADGKTEELAPFPGEARQQTVGEVLAGRFCVFSGGSSKGYVDGYAYDFAKNEWTRLADVELDGVGILLLGAASVRLDDDSMLVIGGFNLKLWDDANRELSVLKDEALAEYKKKYFGMEPFRYGWNRKILVYSASANAWSSIGEVPFDAPCGEALLLMDESVFSINGEIKPGVRTPRIFKGIFVEK